MKTALKIITGLTLLTLMAFVMPLSRAHAESGDPGAHMAQAKAKADQEITRRIDSLNKAISRLGEMKHLSDADKATLTATAQANITTLTNLKAKIDADTDLATLKADIQSITKAYRIYRLVLPRIHIDGASDRMD